MPRVTHAMNTERLIIYGRFPHNQIFMRDTLGTQQTTLSVNKTQDTV